MKRDGDKDVGAAAATVGQQQQNRYLPGFVVRPGDLKRLRGKGMPKRGVPGAYGDLYIRFSVAFPTEDYMSSLTEEQRAQLAALLPKAPEFPWKQTPDTTAVDSSSDTCTDGSSTATATAGTAAGSTTIEAVVEAPDPMVVRAIERGSLSGHGREEHAANSFMRFFV
eukprot:5931-Heterococcus_DN1.PRE.1